MIGAALGFLTHLAFAIFQLAGQILDMQTGFGIVNVIDPSTGTPVPVIGNFKYIVAFILFLSNTAKATMEYKGVTGSGIFKFNDRGEVVEFKANRPRAVGDHFELTPWSIYLTEYHCFDGIQIPSKGEVIWELAGGDFNWFQFEVQEAEYNF